MIVRKIQNDFLVDRIHETVGASGGGTPGGREEARGPSPLPPPEGKPTLAR